MCALCIVVCAVCLARSDLPSHGGCSRRHEAAALRRKITTAHILCLFFNSPWNGEVHLLVRKIKQILWVWKVKLYKQRSGLTDCSCNHFTLSHPFLKVNYFSSVLQMNRLTPACITGVYVTMKNKKKCIPYGFYVLLWDWKGMKNAVDGVPVSLTVCAVSPSSRSKPDAGVTSFREAVITLLLQIRCKVHYYFLYICYFISF